MARILAIDDSIHVVGLIKDILTARKHTVETALSGKEGLEKYDSFRPDLVLLDLAMPEMDGTEVLHRLVEEYDNSKIIIVSAVGNRDLLDECIQRGAIGYIEKPFSVKYLASVVESIVAEEEYPRIFASLSATTVRLERRVQEVLGSGVRVRLAGVGVGTKGSGPEFDSRYASEMALHLQKDTVGFYNRVEGDAAGMIVSFARKSTIDTLLGDVIAERSPDWQTIAADFFNIINGKIVAEMASRRNVSVKVLPVAFHENEPGDGFWENLMTGYRKTVRASFDVLYNDAPAEWETRAWYNI